MFSVGLFPISLPVDRKSREDAPRGVKQRREAAHNAEKTVIVGKSLLRDALVVSWSCVRCGVNVRHKRVIDHSRQNISVQQRNHEYVYYILDVQHMNMLRSVRGLRIVGRQHDSDTEWMNSLYDDVDISPKSTS